MWHIRSGIYYSKLQKRIWHIQTVVFIRPNMYHTCDIYVPCDTRPDIPLILVPKCNIHCKWVSLIRPAHNKDHFGQVPLYHWQSYYQHITKLLMNIIKKTFIYVITYPKWDSLVICSNRNGRKTCLILTVSDNYYY